MNTMNKAPEKRKLPKYMPEYNIQPSAEETFQVRFEEVCFEHVLPKLGERTEYAKYQYPSRKCWLLHKVVVKREVELLGLQGLVVESRCYSSRYGSVLTRNRKVVRSTVDYWQILENDFFTRRERSWKRDRHWSILESGFSPEEYLDLTNEKVAFTKVIYPTGTVEWEGNRMNYSQEDSRKGLLMDYKGCFEVTFGAKSFLTMCVVYVNCIGERIYDVEEHYIDRGGRVVLIRNFQNPEEAPDVLEPYEEWGDGSIPSEEILIVNGKELIHSDDTISEYVLGEEGREE